MDAEVKRYNKIYTDKPEKWADGQGVFRNMVAFSHVSKYVNNPKSIIDIGCGNGHTVEFFHKRWPDTDYWGIDYSDVAIELAKERCPEAVFLLGDYKDYVIHCDLALVMGVAEHFEQLVDGLRSLKDYADLIYLEVPDCLLAGILNGSKYTKEGFRETYKGGLQVEWHLKKSSWEERIKMAGLEILEYLPGSDPITFVWMLR